MSSHYMQRYFESILQLKFDTRKEKFIAHQMPVKISLFQQSNYRVDFGTYKYAFGKRQLDRYNSCFTKKLKMFQLVLSLLFYIFYNVYT